MGNFEALSDIEFEEFVSDLLGSEWATHVERFARGPDGGIDLRWRTKSGRRGVGQCKHYPRSTFSQLLAAAREEKEHVQELNPDQYIFITSQDLTHRQKDTLFSEFADWMHGPDDILGCRDLDGMLTRHPQVERSHPKLWLSTGTQLFWATHAALANRSSALKDRIERNLPRFVMNRGYNDASSILEQHRVCIIAGLPGIGKTMLAHVLVADAMSRGFEPFEVSADIEEAWHAIDDETLQVFLYDDFLGQLSFSESLPKNEDRRLTEFIQKVSRTRTKLLIMTTREYILQEARRAYELMSDLDERMHFVLELTDYTRRDRAMILYNHLWNSNLPYVTIKSVAAGGYKRIVDHRNYSPRLIEYCTGPGFDTQSPDYAGRFTQTLDHPQRLWRNAFERFLTVDQQLLAVALATFRDDAEYGDLEEALRHLSILRAVPTSSARFREALEVMEGTFISIGQMNYRPTVRFHNPSIREFVLAWLAADKGLLSDVLRAGVFYEQVVRLCGYCSVPVSLRRPYAEALRAVLDGSKRDVSEALMRLYEAVPTNQVGAEKWEQRMVALLELPGEWAPPMEWVAERLRSIVARWREGEGNKRDALSLVRCLEKGNDLGLPQALVRDTVDVLDAWLETELNEIDDDWLPYLDRLQTDWGIRLSEKRELAKKFDKFVHQELSIWFPSSYMELPFTHISAVRG